VHPIVSKPSPKWRGECGRVTEALLERLLAEPAHAPPGTPGGGEDLNVIVAGPDAMRANAIRCLVAVGYPENVIVDLNNEEIQTIDIYR
jgi:hypothetical protein